MEKRNGEADMAFPKLPHCVVMFVIDMFKSSKI